MKTPATQRKVILALAALAAAAVAWSATSGIRARRANVVNPAAAAAAARQAAIGAQNAAKESKAEQARQTAALAAGDTERPATSPADQFGQVPPFQGIDGSQVRARLSDWLDSPVRDPFSRPQPVAAAARPSAAPSMATLKLKGVWQQTGGRFAVINNTVVQEGDTFEGYTISRINDNSVILSGTQGLHQLDLPPLAPPPTGTNTPPTGTVAPRRLSPPQHIVATTP